MADEKKSGWRHAVASFLVNYGPQIAEAVFKILTERKSAK